MAKTVELLPGVVCDLPLSLIDFDPEQPRKDVPDDYIQELAESIKAAGVKQPITVRANPGKEGRYFVKYGECRTRASRAAGKKTVPALLDTQDDDTLTRLLDQVRENYHRRDLNPMELADVLERLQRQFGLKGNKAIEDTLTKHGIKRMSREYIANHRRLLKLPDWVQELIRSGRLTAAHGKYLLPALDSEPVLAALRKKLPESEWSVRRLQDELFQLFQAKHDTLGRWDAFDHKTTCAGCKTKRRIVSASWGESTFCLDNSCFEEHREAARTQQQKSDEEDAPRDPLQLRVNDNNEVDISEEQLHLFAEYRPLSRADFDTGKCATCEHRHRAINTDNARFRGDSVEGQESCFDPKCFAARQTEAERLIKSLTEYVRRRLVTEVLSIDTTFQLNLIGWLALQRPSGRQGDKDDDIDFDSYWWGSTSELRETVRRTGLINLNTILTQGAMGHAHEIAALALNVMEAEQLFQIARHFGLRADEYKIVAADWEPMTDEHASELLTHAQALWQRHVSQETGGAQ